MSYDKDKEYIAKYLKDKQIRVPLNWLKEDFENRVRPAIQKTGKPISTFIKDAVNEKLIREGLCLPEDIPSKASGTIKAAIQKYIKNDKKKVLYIIDNEIMHGYVKSSEGMQSCEETWEDAINKYGDRMCESVSDEDHVVEIRCKEIQAYK
jgi:hypothetical protein